MTGVGIGVGIGVGKGVGAMRHLITIERATETRNASGELVRTWTTHITAHARVSPMSGTVVAPDAAGTGGVGKIYHQVGTRFSMRYRAGITGLMRVRWGSRYYRIEAVVNVLENRRDMYIDATEIYEEGTA